MAGEVSVMARNKLAWAALFACTFFLIIRNWVFWELEISWSSEDLKTWFRGLRNDSSWSHLFLLFRNQLLDLWHRLFLGQGQEVWLVNLWAGALGRSTVSMSWEASGPKRAWHTDQLSLIINSHSRAVWQSLWLLFNCNFTWLSKKNHRSSWNSLGTLFSETITNGFPPPREDLSLHLKAAACLLFM